MIEYMFGVVRVRTTEGEADCLDAICKAEGGHGFVRHSEAGSSVRGWFVGPNQGAPYDEDLSRRVAARVRRAEPQLAERLWGST